MKICGNGATAAARHHFRARLGQRFNVELLEIDAFAVKQLARERTVRAPAGDIHHYSRSAHEEL